MARIVSVMLVAAMLAIATGAVERYHNLEHQREDAAAAASAKAAGLPINEHPRHDDSNCTIHLQLHLPIIAAAFVPLLIAIGVLVAFLTMLQGRLAPQKASLSIACRGPPAI